MNVRPLCLELAKIATDELNEDPKKIEDDIKSVKEWLLKQPHLRAPADDQTIVAFLRGCKYSLERTKKKMDMNYSLRSIAPDFFAIKYNSDRFREILDLGVILVLPKSKIVTAPRLMVARLGVLDTDKYHISEIFAVANIIQRMEIYYDDTINISGVEYVGDFTGITAGHILQMTPSVIKKIVSLTIETNPMRVKGIHLQNTPSSLETIITLFKSLLSEKHNKRINVNKKTEYLDNYKYKDILPKELGGDTLTYKQIIELTKEKLKERTEWLEDDLTYGSDESKRPGKPLTVEEYFGVQGSFRQLNID